MTPTLHGEPVFIRDVVFDVSATRGSGHVVAASGNTLEVQFVSGPRVVYNPNGVQLGKGRATLFWQDPILVSPKKNDKVWTAQRKVFAALCEMLEVKN